MTASTQERRHPRAATAERCWIETESVTLYARLENISEGGAFIRTSTPIPEGTQLRLRWTLGEDSEDLEATAVVAWTRSITMGTEVVAGMGLAFKALEASLAGRIGTFVAERAVG